MRGVDHVKKWQIYIREAKTQAEFACRCYEAFQEAERVSAAVSIDTVR